MLIKAHLKGDEFDLINLAELFREGEAAVAADIEGYDLSFTAPEELFHQAARLYDAASVVLRRANAIGRVLTDEFRPVGLTGRFSDETGQQHQVALADSAEVRSRAFVAVATQGGSAAGTSTPPPPSPGYVQLAEAHPDVAEVLYILGRAGPAPGWMELSKVFEIISDTPRAASSGAGSPGTKSACSEAQPIATRSAANLPAMPA